MKQPKVPVIWSHQPETEAYCESWIWRFGNAQLPGTATVVHAGNKFGATLVTGSGKQTRIKLIGMFPTAQLARQACIDETQKKA